MDLRTSFDACSLVDELGASATGEIVVRGGSEGGPRGAVFLEGGRVCWAAARGLARRLTELLGERASIGRSTMEEVFVTCKSEHLPLGEHLVSRGMLRPEDLRAALLQHTVESLIHLCAPDARATFVARSGRGYSPRFTFTTAELLVQIGAKTHESLAENANCVLRSSFDEEDWAAAFVRTRGAAWPEPIALFGREERPASALLKLGKWATSALDVTAAFTDPNALFSTALTSRARALVAFRCGDAVVAGETGAHGPARILNRRATERRKASDNANL